jgi:hypothetical protein
VFVITGNISEPPLSEPLKAHSKGGSMCDKEMLNYTRRDCKYHFIWVTYHAIYIIVTIIENDYDFS